MLRLMRGSFSGWKGTVLGTALGLVAVGGLIGGAVALTHDDAGLDTSAFDEPGGVPLPGRLECAAVAGATPQPVAGPAKVVASTELRDGEVAVADAEGGLWRGDPAKGPLVRFADAPDVGDVQAIARDRLGGHVFVAGPTGVAAVSLDTGEVVSSQPLPAAASEGVIGLATTSRRVFPLLADGELLEVRWAYDRLDEPQPLDSREDVPPARQVLAAPNGEALLLATDGPLLRYATKAGRAPERPLGDVPVTSLTQGVGGLVFLTDGSALRVLDLNERWVTGRLSGPVTGWPAPPAAVTALADGLMTTADDGTLARVPAPTCNREELTRLGTPAP
jgi:hypothetical protein